MPVDGLSFHLMVNHVPILSELVGTVCVILALFIRRRFVWQFGTALVLIAGLSFYPVMLTGDAAEHVDMTRWYVQREAIHEHEETAEGALIGVITAALMAGYALWRASRGPSDQAPVVPGWLRGAVVVTSIAASVACVKTAYEGGFIAHKNPLLDRGTVPPADSIPARPVWNGPPPRS